MSATGSPPHVAAYVAAYTIGLAFTARRVDELVIDLLDAVDRDPATLQRARALIRTMEVSDPRARHRALELVRAALGTLAGGAPERRAHHSTVVRGAGDPGRSARRSHRPR